MLDQRATTQASVVAEHFAIERENQAIRREELAVMREQNQMFMMVLASQLGLQLPPQFFGGVPSRPEAHEQNPTNPLPGPTQ